jgi:hypothetical protein
MSRGPGKVQTLIMDALRGSITPVSAADLREDCELQLWDHHNEPSFDVWNTPARRRSIRMSMGRALRQLESAGHIKRDKAGDWYPIRNWTARDEHDRQRSSTAYHEAGHAVVGLALQLPMAFVTIKPRASTLGHVTQAPVHHELGPVYPRGQYRNPIIAECEQDAFGNSVAARDIDWHAEIVMNIAGGMAQTEFHGGGRTWRELEGARGDRRWVAYARGKLGAKARSIGEYETECEKLIKKHWPMIEAVAAKLLKDETLSGNDVYGICLRTARNVVRRQHLEKAARGKRRG